MNDVTRTSKEEVIRWLHRINITGGLGMDAHAALDNALLYLRSTSEPRECCYDAPEGMHPPRCLNIGSPATRASQPPLATGCHRSHPHDDMSAECERLTEIARENNRRANEPKSGQCEVCAKPLPPVAAWSMPSCPDCQELLEGLGQLMGDFSDREQTIKADWIGRAIDLICARTSPPPSPALRDVTAERERQKSVEGWTPEHDDEHRDGELARAAACYALEHQGWRGFSHSWPWSSEWWKPKDRRRNLVRAGALILAEIERLDRATSTKEVG